MFLPTKDSNGDVYYTMNRKVFPPKPVEESDFFAIGDLLLDLDAEDSKHVRQFTEDDEAQMQKSWKIDHTRRRIEKRVEDVESRVNYIRQKIFKITTRPTNVWRPRTQDVFAVALSTADSHLKPAKTRQKDDRDDTSSVSLVSPREFDAIKTVCSENGFLNRPANDEMLLSWLKLRHRLLESGRNHEPSVSAREVKEALRTQTSITAIRRLISQSLSSGLSVAAFENGLSSYIRDALIIILDQNTPKKAGRLQILTFLSNLKERLFSDGADIGAPLCGLGLRLSAEIAKPEATLEYLSLGFTQNLWNGNPQALGDVESALRSYDDHLRGTSETKSLDAFDRQNLLQILTGVGEADMSPEDCVRSLVTPPFENLSEGDPQQALRIYRYYIMLLGRLGAVKTLWKEWRLTAPYFQSHNDGNLRTRSAQDVTDIFVYAIRASLPIVVQQDGEVATDAGFDECVTGDYQAIEAQNPDDWLGKQQREARILDGLKDGDCREALELPIDGWLDVVGHLARKMSP
ncbi:Fc.00g111060.m01.CDS01 [Cosmosporella sp. VM-42]